MKPTCPLMTTYNSAGNAVLCQEGNCGIWNRQRKACALVAISEELQDLRAEAKRKRMAEAAKEE